jgi:hypothetical protein
MKNKKFIKFLSIFMMAIMLVSTFAMPVLAAADGEVAEEAPTVWDKIAEVATGALAVILGIIFFIVYTVFIIFSALVNLLFVLGSAIVDFVIMVVNTVKGFF